MKKLISVLTSLKAVKMPKMDIARGEHKQINYCHTHAELIPGILENEYCNTCNRSLCYVCGNDHVLHHACSVASLLISQTIRWFATRAKTSCRFKKWRQTDFGKNASLSRPGESRGGLACQNPVSLWCKMKSRISKGTHFLKSEQSAFCVACGNATCSAACHKKYFEHENLCTFSENFDQESLKADEKNSSQNLRSLTLQNIKFAEEQNLTVGMPLNRTSRTFLFGMRHPEHDMVYLQRGFRQYGRIGVLSLEQYLKRHKSFRRIQFGLPYAQEKALHLPVFSLLGPHKPPDR